MREVIPRWEWRAFGEGVGPAEAQLATLEAETCQASDEIYLLSSICDANVKIRGGLMDVKRLVHTDMHGLEQWQPTMKSSFPLPADEVALVLAALGVKATAPERAAYALEQFLVELVDPDRRLRVVRVHKQRARYNVNGCMAERTEVLADSKAVRTVAAESEDPARVLAAIRFLGLEGLGYISYPRGLKRLVGMVS